MGIHQKGGYSEALAKIGCDCGGDGGGTILRPASGQCQAHLTSYVRHWRQTLAKRLNLRGTRDRMKYLRQNDSRYQRRYGRRLSSGILTHSVGPRPSVPHPLEVGVALQGLSVSTHLTTPCSPLVVGWAV